MERKGRRTITILWVICFLWMFSGRASSQHEHGDHNTKSPLGTVEFRVSCTPEAQELFTRGVALLHSFTYEESAEAFRNAATRDQHCAMAHWGLAMTEYHQLELRLE